MFILIHQQQSYAQNYKIDFYNSSFDFSADSTFLVNFPSDINEAHVLDFYDKIKVSNYKPIINALLNYKQKYQLNDWIYYQLIRKTAQELSPKELNYGRYTLYKWFLLCQSGYDARLAIGNNQIIFYIKNHEDIADIPFFNVDGNQYTCLNYHDYGKLFKRDGTYIPLQLKIDNAVHDFSYKVTHMPDFSPQNYVNKKIDFKYNEKLYHFKVKLNNEVNKIFANYPGVDFETYFNIPLSKETYETLIPVLKENLKGMHVIKGVDYLMRFTRYAFLYENDDINFGKEKRLSPEQTLNNQYSDCDDRAALFFYLVKEIYNLPMITLLYPTHITMAVQFEKPIGDAILYNGKYYSLCEPTPQKQNLAIGQLADKLKNESYQIVYHYEPQ
ncbi:hypothetical protein LZQ00_01770 [Sphingobacterium sp. SRCM116780]|nr:hypothetical protein [Sphingobacterium sp. SRCM116780]UIR58002.1 hypothetical protein LZQ00_01770 [Sphingobacterium sp. SRCM116780]